MRFVCGSPLRDAPGRAARRRSRSDVRLPGVYVGRGLFLTDRWDLVMERLPGASVPDWGAWTTWELNVALGRVNGLGSDFVDDIASGPERQQHLVYCSRPIYQADINQVMTVAGVRGAASGEGANGQTVIVVLISGPDDTTDAGLQRIYADIREALKINLN